METMKHQHRVSWAGALVALTVGAAFAGCGVNKEIYEGDVRRLKDQIGDLEKQKTDLFGKYGSEAQRRESCERDLNAMKAKGANLDDNLRKALKRIDDLEKISAKQKAIFDKIRGALDALVKSGKVTVAIIRGQFTVQMAAKILFDSGRYAIKADAEATLKEVTQVLASIPSRFYQVAGHTDNDGGIDSNWKLSGNRALAVTQFMTKEGLPPERLSFAGFGEFQPAAANDSPDNKAQNRRIEIILVPDMEEFMAPFKEAEK